MSEMERNVPQSECSSNMLMLAACDELPGEETVALERHLADCPACRAELEELRAGLADLQALAAPAMSDKAAARIRLAARKALWPRREKHVRQGVRKLTHWLTYAAAAVLALAFVWGALVQPAGDVPAPPVRGSNETTDALPSSRDLAANLLEEGVVGEVLVDSYASDEWSEAAEVVLARVKQEELVRELMLLEMELRYWEEID